VGANFGDLYSQESTFPLVLLCIAKPAKGGSSHSRPQVTHSSHAQEIGKVNPEVCSRTNSLHITQADREISLRDRQTDTHTHTHRERERGKERERERERERIRRTGNVKMEAALDTHDSKLPCYKKHSFRSTAWSDRNQFRVCRQLYA